MKNPIIILVILLVIVSALYITEKVRFPVNLVICDKAYNDCDTYEKYKSRTSCERDRERGNWLCDSGDPNNITCKVATDSMVVSYCD